MSSAFIGPQRVEPDSGRSSLTKCLNARHLQRARTGSRNSTRAVMSHAAAARGGIEARSFPETLLQYAQKSKGQVHSPSPSPSPRETEGESLPTHRCFDDLPKGAGAAVCAPSGPPPRTRRGACARPRARRACCRGGPRSRTCPAVFGSCRGAATWRVGLRRRESREQSGGHDRLRVRCPAFSVGYDLDDGIISHAQVVGRRCNPRRTQRGELGAKSPAPEQRVRVSEEVIVLRFFGFGRWRVLHAEMEQKFRV